MSCQDIFIYPLVRTVFTYKILVLLPYPVPPFAPLFVLALRWLRLRYELRTYRYSYQYRYWHHTGERSSNHPQRTRESENQTALWNKILLHLLLSIDRIFPKVWRL